MEWLSTADALDLLRVGEENEGIVEGLLSSIPQEVEVRTGYRASCVSSDECDPLVRQLVRFMLIRYFNPDGSDGSRLALVVESLTKAVQALALEEE